MANITDGRGGKYFLLGIDWQEKRLGVPTWGWAAALAGAAYLYFRKKR